MGSDISLSKAVRANLLSLQNTASMMDKTQSRLATGNKVNSALDNPSNFFTAASLNSRAADMGNLLDAMASGIKVIEAANNGITALTKNIESMQSTLRQARQDKSFQANTFDVTKDSQLTISGGQFDAPQTIELKTQTAGKSAAVSGSLKYNGPAVAADADTLGASEGARTIITLDAANALQNVSIKVDGKTIALSNSATTAELARDEIQAALGTDDYRVGFNGDDLIIENIKTKGYNSVSPQVDLGTSAATKASTSFVYNAAALGTTISVDGQAVAVGSNAKDFAAAMQQTMGSNYSVSLQEDTGTITVTKNTPGAGNVVIEGTGFNSTGTEVKADVDFTLDNTAAQELTIGGITKSFAAGATFDSIRDAFNADTNFSSKFTLAHTAGDFTATAKGIGVGSIVVQSSVPSQVTAVAQQKEEVAQTRVAGVAGTVSREVAAASDDITVVYGDKTANIKITGQMQTVGTVEDRSEIAKSINDQLKTAGIEELAASFDKNGNLTISAVVPEAKPLTIVGDGFDAAFGTGTAKTSTGEAAISGYNSTNPVDQFVEEINRSFAGKLRASNDNGKLRVENLSTQELSVSFDKDGAAGPLSAATSKIDGNTVRANLSKQFNELRDQLDKLADDASFNGINLLRGDKLKITFNESGSSSIDIQAKDKDGNVRGINASNLNIDSLVAEDLDTDEAIDAYLAKLSSALTELRSQASSFGSNLSSVENRQTFTKNMINTLETGAANLTLADTNEEAANLLALQTRQQLSSSALSMASQQDQAVLQLLR